MKRTFATALIISMSLLFNNGCAEDFNDDIRQLNEMLAQVTEQFDNLNELTDEQQKTIDAYREKINQLREELENANQNIEEQNQTITSFTEEANAAIDEINKQKDDVDKQKEDVAKQKDEVTSMLETVSAAVDDVKKHEEDVNNTVNEINNTVNDINDQISDINDKTDKQQEEINNQQDKINDINDTIEDIGAPKNGSRIIYPTTEFPDGSKKVSDQPYDTVLNNYCLYTPINILNKEMTCCVSDVNKTDDNKLENKVNIYWNVTSDYDYVPPIIPPNKYFALKHITDQPSSSYEISPSNVKQNCRGNELCLSTVDGLTESFKSGNYFYTHFDSMMTVGDIVTSHTTRYLVKEAYKFSNVNIYKLDEINNDYLLDVFVCAE